MVIAEPPPGIGPTEIESTPAQPILPGKEQDEEKRQRVVIVNPSDNRVWLQTLHPDTSQPIWQSVMREEKTEPGKNSGQAKDRRRVTLKVNFTGQNGYNYSLIQTNYTIAGEGANIAHGQTALSMGWHLWSYFPNSSGEAVQEVADFQHILAQTSCIPDEDRQKTDLLEPIRRIARDWTASLNPEHPSCGPVRKNLLKLSNQLDRFGFKVPPTVMK